MRTVIFTLGLLFLSCLTKHLGIEIINDQDSYKYLAYVWLFAVILDVVKK
jgi:hypothetical protein